MLWGSLNTPSRCWGPPCTHGVPAAVDEIAVEHPGHAGAHPARRSPARCRRQRRRPPQRCMARLGTGGPRDHTPRMRASTRALRSMQDKQELIDTYLVSGEQGEASTVEVWAAVSYSDEFGIARRTVGACSFCMRNGSRLVSHGDGSFINTSTGKVLRRVFPPQVAHSVVAALTAPQAHSTTPKTSESNRSREVVVGGDGKR